MRWCLWQAGDGMALRPACAARLAYQYEWDCLGQLRSPAPALSAPCRQVEEQALQALTFVSHRYVYWHHNFLALLFGEPSGGGRCMLPCAAGCPATCGLHLRGWLLGTLLCLRTPGTICSTWRDQPAPQGPCDGSVPTPHSSFTRALAVAEEWRNEPRGLEGQGLVWVRCDELMSYSDRWDTWGRCQGLPGEAGTRACCAACCRLQTRLRLRVKAPPCALPACSQRAGKGGPVATGTVLNWGGMAASARPQLPGPACAAAPRVTQGA